MSNSKLWTIVAGIARNLPRSHIELFADRICEIEHPSHITQAKLSSMNSAAGLYDAWLESGISGAALASALQAAAVALEEVYKQEEISLVWTGPETTAIALRETEVVLCELIERAVSEIILVSFVAYKIPSIITALQRASGRQVKLKLILESSTKLGGSLKDDQFKDLRTVLPSAKMYAWDKPVTADGRIHAKCSIADDKAAFITSANITSFAMQKNMELGILITGGRHPKQLKEHFNALIGTRILYEVGI